MKSNLFPLRYIGLLPLIFALPFYGCGIYNSSVVGVYITDSKAAHKVARLSVNADSTFQFSYGLCGCTYNLTGRYAVSKRLLYLRVDTTYTEDYERRRIDSLNAAMARETSPSNDNEPFQGLPGMQGIYFPKLYAAPWKVHRKWIRLTRPLDLGCFVEKGRYRKVEEGKAD